MGKLESVGLTFIAAIAISATMATSAFAGYHIASSTGGTVSGSQQIVNEFYVGIGVVRCSTATVTGSLFPETSSTMNLHPAYSNCTLSGQKVTVTTTGCNYEFQKPVTTPLSATVLIQCSVGNILIKDTAGLGCEIKIPTQGPLLSAGFENGPLGESGKVLVTYALGGITNGWTAGCPGAFGKSGFSSVGEYRGTVLLTGSSALSVI